jgi:hypothetical protein
MLESIKQLLSLQGIDLELDRCRVELGVIPKQIATIRKEIEDTRTQLESSKKELTQLQLTRKEREVDLETKEAAIRKHSTDLNSIKTNDAYRALLGEIEKVKGEKSALEDVILLCMDQIDQATRAWKEQEAAAKKSEGERLQQIAQLEAKAKDLEQRIVQEQAERDALAGSFASRVLEPYERLRKSRPGAAVVPLKGLQCSGCHMSVSQNVINEIRRGQKLIPCDYCSRIVYLEEVAATSK